MAILIYQAKIRTWWLRCFLSRVFFIRTPRWRGIVANSIFSLESQKHNVEFCRGDGRLITQWTINAILHGKRTHNFWYWDKLELRLWNKTYWLFETRRLDSASICHRLCQLNLGIKWTKFSSFRNQSQLSKGCDLWNRIDLVIICRDKVVPIVWFRRIFKELHLK